jgi:hypothetical protein
MLVIWNCVRRNFELLFWLAALAALALSNPTQPHYTLCPFKLMGITWCPGCGIGHAISFLFHANVAASWRAHWLGIPALLILVYRIIELIRKPRAFKPGSHYTIS